MGRPTRLWQVEWSEKFRAGGPRRVERRFTTEGRAAAQAHAVESAPEDVAQLGGVWCTTAPLEWAPVDLLDLLDLIALIDAEPIENFDDYREEA